MSAWMDAAAAAMQLTVKALQGRECSLQVASPSPRCPPCPGLRAGLRVGSGRRAGGRAAALGRPGEPPASGAAGSTPAPALGQVSEDELVSTLKQLVSEKLNVPVRQQRLLFKGKALAGNGEEEVTGEPCVKSWSGVQAELGLGHRPLDPRGGG